MSIFKTLEPSDKSRRVFETNKNFSFNQNDSGSGVFVVKARSGSFRNYISSSDAITTITSDSIDTNYFALPTWNFVNTRYHAYSNQETSKIPYRSFGFRPRQSRSLHSSASVFSITKDVIGERIKPGSLTLTDTSNSRTFNFIDDGDGNLFDFVHSASYAAHKSSSFDITQGVESNGSSSVAGNTRTGVVGNVFYSDGVVVVNQLGSYKDVGFGSGFTLKYKSTHNITEYEYVLRAPAGQFNMTSNVSITKDRAGNIRVPQTSSDATDTDRSWVFNLFPPNHLPTGEGTGSFNSKYIPASHSIDNITGSDWYPMVSQIGLYDIEGDLLAVAKPGQPVKLSSTLSTTFVVRFDV
tara:strand:- start:51 stop:1109 length:1059 start_codon:yes stop_codon:yes gene_type:complete